MGNDVKVLMIFVSIFVLLFFFTIFNCIMSKSERKKLIDKCNKMSEKELKEYYEDLLFADYGIWGLPDEYFIVKQVMINRKLL